MLRPARHVPTAAALVLLTAACSAGSTTDTGDDALADLTGSQTEQAASEDVAVAGPVGPGCDVLPADGEGSAAALAQVPTVDAIGQIAALSELDTVLRQTVVPTTVEGVEEVTVFAPTDDEAFAAIDDQQLSDLVSNTDALTDVLTLHLVDSVLPSSDLAVGTTVTSLLGQDLEVVEGDGELPAVMARESTNVVCADIATADGVIHLVDGVLFPDEDQAAEAGSQDPDPGDDETLGD